MTLHSRLDVGRMVQGMRHEQIEADGGRALALGMGHHVGNLRADVGERLAELIEGSVIQADNDNPGLGRPAATVEKVAVQQPVFQASKHAGLGEQPDHQGALNADLVLSGIKGLARA